MGNYRFRLSDMLPNAWFYKLKDMSKSRNQQKIIYHNHGSKKKPHHTPSSSSSYSSSSSFSSSLSSKERKQQRKPSNQRKSYYFSRDLSTAAAAPPPPGSAECDVKTSSFDNAETKTRISDGNYPEPPRKSSKKRRSTRRNGVSNSNRSSSSPCCRGKLVTSSVGAAGCSCGATVESGWTKPDSSTAEEYPISPLNTSSENEASLPEFGSNNPRYTPETFDTMLSWSSPYCRGKQQDKDIIMDIGNEPVIAKFHEPADKGDELGTVSQINLPPIITNHHQSGKSSRKKMETLPDTEPTKTRRSAGKLEERNDCGSVSVKEDISSPKGQQKVTPAPARRFSANSSQGLKLRTNSPRMGYRRRIQGRKSVSFSSSRRSMSESFAVVKSSKDPQRDFRDSMVEMIIENNLCASKDLEDLLACYLSLNSDEYHDLIISVFKQIWFDIIDIHPK